MGLFGRSKKKSTLADFSKLEEAVFRDCGGAFAAMEEARPNERIYGLAVCIDNDGTSFYIMGNTVEGCLENENQGRETPWAVKDLKPDSFFYNPADWAYQYPLQSLKSVVVMDAIWKAATENSDETQAKVHRAIIQGLKKFDQSGAFAGKLPREKMVLTLWQNDPDHPEWVIEWAKELNPPKAFAWFKAGYPYEADGEQ